MRILLLAPITLKLYEPILNELKSRGHDVTFIEDYQLPYDWYSKVGNLFSKFVKCVLWFLCDIPHRYWRNKLNEPVFTNAFDFLIVIQGQSFDRILLDCLRKNNPKIKTVLYLWDNNSYYDYMRNAKYFDKVLTYDLSDSKIYSQVDFLPFYWLQSQYSATIEYDLSMVGSDHDDRYDILRKIEPILSDSHAKVYIRLCLPKESIVKLSIQERIHHPLNYKNLIKKKELTLIQKKAFKYSHIGEIPHEEVNRIIAQSNCILDTDRPSQTGTTPRVIWALAAGKKIISTNKNLIKLPFYNSKQIQIIDRDNPQIDMEFIKQRSNFDIHSTIIELRIDKWIDRILS